MSHSILEQVLLTFTPMWSRERQPAGVRVQVGEIDEYQIDAIHLLRTLQDIWGREPSQLMLCLNNPVLIDDALSLPQAPPFWLELPQEWLVQPGRVHMAYSAALQGFKLVWPQAQGPDGATGQVRHLASWQPILQALNHSICLPVSHLTQAQECLDTQRALALLDWPCEDTLRSCTQQQLPCDHAAVQALMRACDAEASTEALEHLLGMDPLLAYRLLQYVNSAAFGGRATVHSLKHALMMLGYSALNEWLAEQLPTTTRDPNFRPVRHRMVMRARLMEQMLETGSEDELRRELHTCGLFSGMNLLFKRPQADILQRVPLPDRILSAIVQHEGEYWPYLDMVCALESGDLARVSQAQARHGLPLGEVNRALLKVISTSAASVRPALAPA